MSRLEKTEETASIRPLLYAGGTILVVALVVSLVRTLLPILQILLPILAGWWWWQRYRKIQTTQQTTLNTVFYQLLRQHQGRMTVLDFAMTAHLPATTARQFLDARAREFSARFEVTEVGDVIYLFPTLAGTPLPPDSLAPQPAELPTDDGALLCLTQTQLAQRLGVSQGTLSRKKYAPDLAAWSQAKDPEGTAWLYRSPARRFFPVR